MHDCRTADHLSVPLCFACFQGDVYCGRWQWRLGLPVRELCASFALEASGFDYENGPV